ncbi:MAG TPA: IS481 family transposase [Chloroflexota bacterium]|nr:IS481 family transposase [Chloroflexota bacterium]
MDVGSYLVEAHLRDGRSVAELARVHGVHRSWLYKLLGRYRAQGEAGLAPRSRRPHRSPTALRAEVIEGIVRQRSDLLAQGLDAGALTIQWHLARQGGRVPSVSSIVRVLRRRGLVVPQPHKRPRSSFIRFEAALPNQLWQIDATHWTLAGECGVEILNLIDDHSRLVVASVAFDTVKAADVVAVFHGAAQRCGYPAALLSDNAAVFSGGSRKGKVLLESELERLGIRPSHARHYHPQTCGKVERLHQTQKRWLSKQPAAATLQELCAQLDRFRLHYNQHRPHRALGRRTPQEVFEAKVKAGPGSAVPPVHYRVRYDTVDRNGKVTLRYDSRLHHIGLGARHRGKAIVLFVADRDIRIVDADGELLRQLVLDPTRDYQRQSA